MSNEELTQSRYGIRCIFKAGDRPAYEERITVWLTESFDSAIRMAELEAADYADGIGLEYVGLAQAYDSKSETIESGSEVFSLIRISALEPTDYVDHFFATGTESEQRLT
jgi:hypothetical protein